MFEEAEPSRADLHSSREKLLPLLRRAFRLNVTRPLIPGLAIGSALLVLLIGLLISGEAGPGRLMRMFALTPLDVYSDLSTARNIVWVVPLLFMRAAVLTLFVSTVLDRRGRLRDYLRVCLISVAGSASFVVLYLLGVGYIRATEVSGPLALSILVLVPIAHLVVTAIFSPVAVRVAVGRRVRSHLRDRSIWILAATSTCIWMFWPRRVSGIESEGFTYIAYCLAFVALFVQSTLFTAVTLRSAGDEPLASLPTRERKTQLLDRSVA